MLPANPRVLPEPIQIYVCFEPEKQMYAERLNSWPWTNEDLDFYNRRVSVAVGSPEAELIKVCLRQQIEQADVTVCVIFDIDRPRSLDRLGTRSLQARAPVPRA